MKSLDIPVESKPYLNTSCEIPDRVPTKWLLVSLICFFLLSTVAIIAFMRYDENKMVTKAHHEAEVKALVTKLEQARELLESRLKDTEDGAMLFYESMQKIDPDLKKLKAAVEKLPPPKAKT